MEKGQSKSNDLKLLHDFEEWLQGENAKLIKTLAVTSSSTEEIKARQSKLEVSFQGTKMETKIARSSNSLRIRTKNATSKNPKLTNQQTPQNKQKRLPQNNK